MQETCNSMYNAAECSNSSWLTVEAHMMSTTIQFQQKPTNISSHAK